MGWNSVCVFLIGNGESLYAQEYEGDKTDPLPEWSSSRENELPPKVNLDMYTPCTTSYYLLPKNVNSYKFMLFPFQLMTKFLLGHSQSQCLTLKSSYRTELGQSTLNNTLVSATSGREDCFKFRTKNHYEGNIFKCEDDM